MGLYCRTGCDRSGLDREGIYHIGVFVDRSIDSIDSRGLCCNIRISDIRWHDSPTSCSRKVKSPIHQNKS